MLPYPNLVSDSLLVNSTIDFLISVGGSAPAVNVVDHVMRIRDPHPDFARVLIADVIDRDPRLELCDDHVSLTEPDHPGSVRSSVDPTRPTRRAPKAAAPTAPPIARRKVMVAEAAPTWRGGTAF